MRPSQRPVADPEAADPVSVLVLFGAPELAGLTSTSLEREGIRVTVAETPEEAVDCVETGDVDCVVTDVVDPGVDDGSLLRQLRALRPGLPYVLFTSHLPPGLAVEALRLGATDYVERAAGTEQYARLAARVREAVARYRSDRRLAQFDRALDEVTEGLAMVDDEGVLVHANEAFQSRFGLESGVVSGTPLVEALTPAAAETLETELRPTLEEAGRWVGYLGGDGDLLCSATALPDGGYALVVTPLEDDRVEREFEALQRRYRSVFTQGFDAMLIADDEGRYVEANPAARRLLGLPTERILGRRIDEFAEEEYDFEAAWETFLEEGRMAGEFTLVRPDGERRVLEFEARADVVPGEHLSVLRDVTERIEHEAELERAYQRYHTVVESLPELAVVLVDDAGRYLVVDGGGVPALGLEGEVPPRTPVRSVHAPAVADTLGALYDRICGGEPLHTELEVGERTLSLVGRPVEGPEGGRAAVAVFRDVTERRAQEARIREQNERLEEFASVVSHDLRTPLAVASGWVELARGDEDPNESLDRVGAALDRMGELVTGVLELARSGAVDPEPDVPLAAVARAAWSESTATTGATLEAPTDLGTVTADPDRLHELLCNLFRNAVEHGTGGDGAEDADDSSGPTVRVGRLDDDGFYVEDDGPGIPAEDRETVFDRGFTTGGSGTGLGLYIVSRIAAAHGWTVEAVEGKTGGARFEVRFCRR